MTSVHPVQICSTGGSIYNVFTISALCRAISGATKVTPVYDKVRVADVCLLTNENVISFSVFK